MTTEVTISLMMLFLFMFMMGICILIVKRYEQRHKLLLVILLIMIYFPIHLARLAIISTKTLIYFLLFFFGSIIIGCSDVDYGLRVCNVLHILFAVVIVYFMYHDNSITLAPALILTPSAAEIFISSVYNCRHE